MATPPKTEDDKAIAGSLSLERARTTKKTMEPVIRSSSAGATFASSSPPRQTRQAPREKLEKPMPQNQDSPLLFKLGSSDRSISGLSIGETVPRKAAPNTASQSLPPITLVYEGRGGTFYYGADAGRRFRDQCNRLSGKRALVQNITNQRDPKDKDKPTDYFLLDNAIGTEALISCAAVFFTIGTNRLFLAHIDISRPGERRGSLIIRGNEIDIAAGRVTEKLNGLANEQNWTRADVDLDSVRVVTPRIEGTEFNACARAVLQGVTRFLGISWDKEKGAYAYTTKDPNVYSVISISNYYGFVVEIKDERAQVTESLLGEIQPIHGYVNSGHSITILADTWRYAYDVGWGISP